MTTTAFDKLRDRLVEVTGLSPKRAGNNWMFRCPAHEDRTPSLRVRPIEGSVLVRCGAGCDTRDVLAGLSLTERDLYDSPRGDELDRYVYADHNGRRTRVVHRREGKRFDQSGDKSLVQLYRLPRILAANPEQPVYLVEGEKDVHALESVGDTVVATTAPMGADNFDKVDVSPLQGRRVIAVRDRDAGGVKWSTEVHRRLDGYAIDVRIVEAKAGKDAADHIAAGHGLDDLVLVAEPTKFARTLLRRSQLRDLPRVEPLIDSVLSLRTAAVLFGPTGAGKTALALGWAFSVGTGIDWLGHSVTRVPAMYVIGEGAAGLDPRVEAWEYAWQTKVSDDDVIFSVKPDSFTGLTVWTELTAEARDLGRRFVILDTFSSLAPDADETRDAPTFTRRLSDLATAIDGTAVAVHHPGWSDSDRTRGGYQLEANVDEVLKLAGGPGSPLVELTRKKVKDGPSGARMWLRRITVDLGIDQKGKPYSSVVIESASSSEVETPLRERILVELAELGDVGATGPQLLAAMGIPAEKRASLYKALRGLISEGSVTKDKKYYREVSKP